MKVSSPVINLALRVDLIFFQMASGFSQLDSKSSLVSGDRGSGEDEQPGSNWFHKMKCGYKVIIVGLWGS